MTDEQRKRERNRKRERESKRERQGDRNSTDDLTNCPQKGGEMSHLFVVGATVGHHEKTVKVEREREREPKNRLQPREC